MTRHLLAGCAAFALLAGPAPAQDDETGQDPMTADLAAFAAAIGNTSITSRSHSVPPGGQINSAEGTACGFNRRMVSGACHPGFDQRVRIVNQFPNVSANAWRCGFRNAAPIPRTAWVYTLCTENRIVVAPPPVRHNLSVSRHSTTPLTNGDADRILRDGTRVAQTSDHAGDTACNTEFRRSGNVAVLPGGDGSIDSGAEFSALLAMPGWVKAVNQINWCGSIAAGIIGCAPVPGASLAVVRFTPALEGILWLHEFAHNKGRGHRNGTQNVMHPSIGATRLGLNADECNALRTLPASENAAVFLAAGEEETLPESDVPAPEDVTEFVRQHFVAGVPYAVVVAAYGPEDVPPLLEMLGDSAEAEWQVNVIAVLGMIGTEEQVFEPLVATLEEGGEVEDPMAYRARATVPLALGYLANGGSEAALDYLAEAAQPTFWRRTETARASFQASADEAAAQMATQAQLGLALAGTEEALATLEALAAERAEDVDPAVVQEALDAARTVSEMGLQGYYEDQEER